MYDSLGNRISDQFGNYNYDNKRQRLTEDWKYQYTYDENGNISSRILKSDNSKVTSYIHNSQNQLVKIQEYNSTTLLKETSYFYDILGRRVQKSHTDYQSSSNSFERKFTYDGQEILTELDQNNNVKSIFTHSNLRTDDVLAVDKAGTSYFFLKDHLGTVNDIIDSNGNLVQHYIYSPFGKIRKIENASGADITATPMLDNFYTFTGREYDKESGLFYYRARYLDSEAGRFIEADPHPGKIGSSLTVINKYIYGGNNPLNMVDPSGQSFWRSLATIAVTAVLAYAVGFGVGYLAMSAMLSAGATVGVGAIVGSILGGLVGSMIGGEIAFRTNRILGGSAEESRKFRTVGKIVGGIAGGFGGSAGAESAIESFVPSADAAIKTTNNLFIAGACILTMFILYKVFVEDSVSKKTDDLFKEDQSPTKSGSGGQSTDTSGATSSTEGSGGNSCEKSAA